MPKPSVYSATLAGFLLSLAATSPAAVAAPQAATINIPQLQSSSSSNIIRNVNSLPAPVRLMRERILKAAESGNIEALRPLFADKNGLTRIVPQGSKQDPIEYLKEISADGEGLDILANLVQILNIGAAHLNAGTAQDSYVWPYLAALNPDKLSKPEMVEAYQIMSADDLDTIKEVGHYIFFRVGIAPNGQWQFFLTTDDEDQGYDNETGDDMPTVPKRGDSVALPDQPSGLPDPSDLPDNSDDLPDDE